MAYYQLLEIKSFRSLSANPRFSAQLSRIEARPFPQGFPQYGGKVPIFMKKRPHVSHTNSRR
jgi:hypothetical protein